MKPMVKCGILWIVLSMILNVVTIAVIIYLAVAVSPEISVPKAFDKYEVVPDVIPKAPTALAKVVYGGVEVHLGNELTPTQVKDMPNVTWWNCDCQYYTLVMTDPDAPSRAKPTSREWQHWIIGNIRGDNVTGGELIDAYVGAGPPPKTGLHRYVFLVYKQPGLLTFDEPRLNNTSTANRTNFSVAKFAVKHNLGDPIAGNFFQAKYDSYVPKLFKQLNAA